MDTSKNRVIFEYEFRRGTNVAETARNINAAFGEETANERTVRFWFQRFRNGNFDLKNEPRGRPPTQKGCPSCGFSYCSKCLDNKVFVKKLNSEAKVCAKCKKSTEAAEPKKIEPPDAYYKRLGLIPNDPSNPQLTMGEKHPKDQEILNRLMQLKEDSKKATAGSSEAEIAVRLKKIQGEMPSTSDAELQERLAKLRGVPVSTLQSKPVLLAPDTRTEQEQANDLLKQYMEQTKIDGTYKDEFDGLVNDIESRLGKLKGASSTKNDKPIEDAESEDEEETVRKIVEKVKAEASLDIDQFPATNDELPFCEICNEDATMRCLGCRYLFCKRCYLEHRDDDECNRYEPYSPPKESQH